MATARRKVVRTWGRHGAAVATEHPQVGLLYRGRIRPARSPRDGAGAWGVG